MQDWVARAVLISRSSAPWRIGTEESRVGIMMTCDYNGWNDAPEEEREWFDQHPEIWIGLHRERDTRPRRVTADTRHPDSSMAA